VSSEWRKHGIEMIGSHVASNQVSTKYNPYKNGKIPKKLFIGSAGGEAA
jgi:aspartyl aminopeptidase